MKKPRGLSIAAAYTYDNWIDLIYNELYQGRPVVYGGEGTDVGHEFVCDGYMYEGGDLFHINWGWGGMSDGYFVLSVLNPDEQGIGGLAQSRPPSAGRMLAKPRNGTYAACLQQRPHRRRAFVTGPRLQPQLRRWI